MSESNALIQPTSEEKFLEKTGDYKKQALEREALAILDKRYGGYCMALHVLAQSYFGLSDDQVNKMDREELVAMGKILFKKSAFSLKVAIGLSLFACLLPFLCIPVSFDLGFAVFLMTLIVVPPFWTTDCCRWKSIYWLNYRFLQRRLGEDFLSKHRDKINWTDAHVSDEVKEVLEAGQKRLEARCEAIQAMQATNQKALLVAPSVVVDVPKIESAVVVK